MGKSKTDKRLKNGIIISLLFHLSLVILTLILPNIQNPQKLNIVEIDYASPEDRLNKDQLKDDKLKQIVDQDDNAVNNELDPNAKYLSKNSQTVKKQTISKNRGEFRNSKGDSPTLGAPDQPKMSMQQLLPKVDYAKAYEEKLIQEKIFEQEALRKAQELADKPPQDADHQKQSSQKFTQKPPQPVGGAPNSQSLDYIKDLDPGLETMLSTREFVYYTFYNRVRNQLAQHWGTKVRERLVELYRQGRMIASTDDKISKLLITLSRTGQILKIQVIGNSGYKELDEAAVDAFKAAAPFPNPPAGIVEEDGTIRIRWDFILEAWH